MPTAGQLAIGHHAFDADDGLSRSSSVVTAGLLRSTFPARMASITAAGKASNVHLEPHRQRCRRIDVQYGFVHPQHVRPELLVPERVEAEDRLAVLALLAVLVDGVIALRT